MFRAQLMLKSSEEGNVNVPGYVDGKFYLRWEL